MEASLVDYHAADAWDEIVDTDGSIRPAYREVVDSLRSMRGEDLRGRAEQLARTFTERGVTYAYGGVERPFPLDPVPRIIEAAEWAQLSAGVIQRVRALECFLNDAYTEGVVFNEGIIPRRLITSSPEFNRAAVGITPPNGVRIQVAGIDVIRDERGGLRVLEDNVRIPSGVSYVMENRRAMTRTLPGLFSGRSVLPVDLYPQRLLNALKQAAPVGVHDPVIAVLTPGVHNAAYFEHSLLARRMGIELVEGRDLVCHSNKLYMRTTSGEARVDVIYRRVDDGFLDPLHGNPSSLIGVAGLFNAARAGNVTIANAVGNGIADDKLMYTYVPDLIRFFLDEEPILDNVETHRLEDRDVLTEVAADIGNYVIKPVDGAGGAGIVIGPQADDETLAATREAIIAAPRRFIAQRVVAISTHPTLIEGNLAPRHIDLRPFCVNDGNSVWVLPGGLTRVALPEGALVVNSSQGGGSKDTWVIADHGPGDSAISTPTPWRAVPETVRQDGPSSLNRSDQQ